MQRYFRRFLCELRHSSTAVWHSRSDATFTARVDVRVPLDHFSAKNCSGFRPKHHAVQIILHGLSGVVGKRFRHPVRRFQDMKTALTLFGNNGIHYLVLEQFIRDTL